MADQLSENTGMSLHEIRRFVNLAREGDHTLKQPLELLQAHRDDVIARMDEIRRYLEKVNWKTGFYNQKLQEYEDRNEGHEEDRAR